jgi:nitronate monooxygenase
VRRLPARVQRTALGRQRPPVPLLAPVPPTDDGPASLLDSGPLYAGTTVARIADVRPAAAIVAALAGAA